MFDQSLNSQRFMLGVLTQRLRWIQTRALVPQDSGQMILNSTNQEVRNQNEQSSDSNVSNVRRTLKLDM